MDRLFRIDFYPHDWLVKTGGLTPGQCGIYIQIVALIYASRGPIANDPARIGRLLNCSPRLARKLIGELAQVGKLEIRGGFVTNSRCESELNIKRTHLESSAKGGRKSAENRWGNNKTSDLDVSDTGKPLVSPSPSPIATPIETRAGDALNNMVFFEEFWLAYPKKVQKGFARKSYERAVERIPHSELMEGLRRHNFPMEVKFAPKPADWLDGDCWLDQAVGSGLVGSSEPWKMRIQGWREKKFWLARWGDTPDSPHCLCPREIIEAA